ncbi:hypothetical protein JW752_02055 [Candidatus Peregrinibacteria bacterium]|nr:hypothetical protein [Candidatus Peregrinibacteria bacterium]
MPAKNQHPEAEKKQPSAHESVESFIGRKKAEKEAEVREAVSEKMAGTQEEVAEVIGSAEKPKEKVSKKAGEKGEGKMPAGKAPSDDQAAQVITADLKDYDFPSEEVMVKKIRTAIQAQIKFEWKRAKNFQGKLDSGGADGYNKSIARIRSLKQVLASLFTSAAGFLKNLYVKYFTPDGKRRKMEEVE